MLWRHMPGGQGTDINEANVHEDVNHLASSLAPATKAQSFLKAVPVAKSLRGLNLEVGEVLSASVHGVTHVSGMRKRVKKQAPSKYGQDLNEAGAVRDLSGRVARGGHADRRSTVRDTREGKSGGRGEDPRPSNPGLR